MSGWNRESRDARMTIVILVFLWCWGYGFLLWLIHISEDLAALITVTIVALIVNLFVWGVLSEIKKDIDPKKWGYRR